MLRKLFFVAILILITIMVAGCFSFNPPNVCEDNDGDGYGLPGSSSCDFSATDCNDNNATINPGATEICDNGVDDDCVGGDLICVPQSENCTVIVQSGQSIQSAVNAASSGDVICIAPGNYIGRVQVNTPGITIKGQTRRTATVINGFEINVPNTRIEGLKITTNTFLSTAVMLWEAADNTKIYDNYFYNVSAGSSIWGPSGSIVTPSNVHIKDNLFHRVQIGIHAVGDNWLIENNEIDTLYQFGSGGCQYNRFHGSNQIWRNNYWHGATLANTGSGHVDCFQTWDQGNPHLNNNNTIENNTCIDFHAFAMIQAQEGGGQIDGLVIRNNVGMVTQESGYLDSAFSLNLEDATNMIIEHNTFIGATWYSIYFNDIWSPDHPSGVMKNNIIMNAGSEAWNSNGCQGDCQIKNNIWWNSINPTPYPDSTNINVNPQLTNIQNLNFKPLDGSPACTGGEGGTYVGAVPCGSSPACIDNDNDGYGQYCLFGPDCNDNDASINPGATEICEDGIDQDCDGEEVSCSGGGGGGGTSCIEGYERTCDTSLSGVCSEGTETCTNGEWSLCIQNQQPTSEVCTDNLDNDCDGASDCDDNDCINNPICQTSQDCTVTVQSGQSIQNAVNAASSGAVICIAPGTYNGRVSVTKSGITIKGQSHWTATVVDGFDINAPNVRIEGLKMTTSVQPWPSILYLDTNADYAKIYDNYFYEIDGVVIRAETGNLGDASFVHVKDNVMYRVNWGMHVSGNNWIVENNEIDTLVKFIDWLDNDYVVIWGNNHIFRNNYFHGTNENSIGASHVNCFQTYDWTNPYTVHNILIENNTCFGFHEFLRLQAWNNKHDNITVRNNIMVVFPDTGFLNNNALPVRHIVVESAPHVTIEHNTMIGANPDNLVSMEGTASGSIKNNLIANMPTGYDANYCVQAGCVVAVGYNMIWNYTQSAGSPSKSTNILQSTGFVDPIVTNNRSKWKPTNPIACTGGEGGTYIGAVPCN